MFFPAPSPHLKSSSFLCDPNNLCVLYQMNSTELTWYIFLTSQMFVRVHASIYLLRNLDVLGLMNFLSIQMAMEGFSKI